MLDPQQNHFSYYYSVFTFTYNPFHMEMISRVKQQCPWQYIPYQADFWDLSFMEMNENDQFKTALQNTWL